MAEDDSGRDYQTHFVRPIIWVAILVGFVGILPLITGAASWFGDDNIKRRLEMLGAFGDMFGFLNTSFSGIAFVAIYYTLRIQLKQYQSQLEDINMKKEGAGLIVNEPRSQKTVRRMVPGGEKRDDGTKELCPARYARVAIENVSDIPARECRVLLTAIKKRDREGNFIDIENYEDSLRLLQFTESDNAPESTSVSIHLGAPQYFNVCSIKEDPPDNRLLTLVQVAHEFSKYETLDAQLEFGATYQFCLSVVSENARTLAIDMIVLVGTSLDDLTVASAKGTELKGKIVYAR